MPEGTGDGEEPPGREMSVREKARLLPSHAKYRGNNQPLRGPPMAATELSEISILTSALASAMHCMLTKLVRIPPR